MFLNKVDQSKYGDLYASIYNQFTRGTDQYPQSLTGVYNTINEHHKERVEKLRKSNRRLKMK